MISSASTLFIASLVFSSAVLGAPIRISDGSQVMPRAESTTPPVIAREIVDVPDNRQRDIITRRSRLVFAREDVPSAVVEARDSEEPTLERRYPRRALYERFEKRAPDVTVVGWKREEPERKFPRRSLYERYVKREPATSVKEDINLNVHKVTVFDTPEDAEAFENVNLNSGASATAVVIPPTVVTTAISSLASITTVASPAFTPGSSSSFVPPPVDASNANINAGSNPPLNVPITSVSTFPAGGSGLQIDPSTGLPINAPTVDPATGLPVIPPAASFTGSVVPPTINTGSSNVPTNPGLATDPNTGFKIDPLTGFPINPTTGQAFDPATGLPVNSALSGTIVPPVINTGSTSSFGSASSVVPPVSSDQQPPAVVNQPPIVSSSTSTPSTTDPNAVAGSTSSAVPTSPVTVDPATGAPPSTPPVTVDTSTTAPPADASGFTPPSGSTPAGTDPSVTVDPAAAAAASASATASSTVPPTRRSLFGRSVGFSGAAWAAHIRREAN